MDKDRELTNLAETQAIITIADTLGIRPEKDNFAAEDAGVLFAIPFKAFSINQLSDIISKHPAFFGYHFDPQMLSTPSVRQLYIYLHNRPAIKIHANSKIEAFVEAIIRLFS